MLTYVNYIRKTFIFRNHVINGDYSSDEAGQFFPSYRNIQSVLSVHLASSVNTECQRIVVAYFVVNIVLSVGGSWALGGRGSISSAPC